jgi:hypothetical protein
MNIQKTLIILVLVAIPIPIHVILLLPVLSSMVFSKKALAATAKATYQTRYRAKQTTEGTFTLCSTY